MLPGFLHHHQNFGDLLRIVSNEQQIDPYLVEKDYWIMQSLYGLQQMGLDFELKGGTSLSKGFGIINRFSEDIDIRIEPPNALNVNTNPKSSKPNQVESRKHYYDWLAQHIEIDGVTEVERDTAFDDQRYYRSGGVRLIYPLDTRTLSGVKGGVLLEVGFDDVTPNIPETITSWAYEYAKDKVAILDNRAKNVACYHTGYTFVEKLQTISTRFRQQQQDGSFPVNFMRHYYDVYCLLEVSEVKQFIGTPDYFDHKTKRFRNTDNPDLSTNEAFLLSDHAVYELYANAYHRSANLYYRNQPPFSDVLNNIKRAVRNLSL